MHADDRPQGLGFQVAYRGANNPHTSSKPATVARVLACGHTLRMYQNATRDGLCQSCDMRRRSRGK
jgi:hypothetical protein